ncbi:MAG: ribbon-helix-helix protein, CopG family [Chromatiales bacterium]|nr:ribbon-helix-helix protein, CopG family [Chromatiales bacterium]
MSLMSLRLPEELEVRLDREAARSGRGRSEIARTAIAEYLARQEREQFVAEYVRSAMGEDREAVLARAEEFLPLEDEALALAESGGKSRVLAARAKPTTYRRKKARRQPR